MKSFTKTIFKLAVLTIFTLCHIQVSAQGISQGSGFAIAGGYIVTNSHVVDGCCNFLIIGQDRCTYRAKLVASDANIDLAVLKISDQSFSGFGAIPYSIKRSQVGTGEDCFALGYPVAQYLGTEVKLTKGVISSQSGLYGDPIQYQIDANITHGSSGGALFDSSGDIIGMTSSGVPGIAEYICYAIKSPYLVSFLSRSGLSSYIPSHNNQAGKSLSEIVKAVKSYIFIVLASTEYIPVPISRISLSKLSVSMSVGDTKQLSVNVFPTDADVTSVKWTSSDTRVATVRDGVVSGVQNGHTTISVQVNGEYYASCNVVVNKIKASGLKLNKAAVSIEAGKHLMLEPVFSPLNTTNKSVVWSSSNIKVATVSDSGEIFGVDKGSAVISAKSIDGGFVSNCSVRVFKTPVKDLFVDGEMSLDVGDSKVITATFSPESASIKQVEWTCENLDIVNVDNGHDGASVTVYGKKEGACYLHAKSVDGNFVKHCRVQVKNVPVKSIRIFCHSLRVEKGNTYALKAFVYPSNATEKGISWKSLNPSIAIISDNGTVTAISEGTAMIVAMSKDGGHKDECRITVYANHVESVKLPSKVTLKKWETRGLSPIVSPNNATDRRIEWNSSNPRVAEYKNGYIQAYRQGHSKITATSVDGRHTASTDVKVKAAYPMGMMLSLGMGAWFANKHDRNLDFNLGYSFGHWCNLFNIELGLVFAVNCGDDWKSLPEDALYLMLRPRLNMVHNTEWHLSIQPEFGYDVLNNSMVYGGSLSVGWRHYLTFNVTPMYNSLYKKMGCQMSLQHEFILGNNPWR